MKKSHSKKITDSKKKIDFKRTTDPEITDSADFDVEKSAHYKQIEHLQTPYWGEEGQSPRDVALAYLQLEPVREALELDVPREIPDPGPDHGWTPRTTLRAPWTWLPDRTITRAASRN